MFHVHPPAMHDPDCYHQYTGRYFTLFLLFYYFLHLFPFDLKARKHYNVRES